jgi:phenylalanyl-tRNA synthetase beta chain
VDATTTSIVFESARFSPAGVRRAIKAHGVRTDSSFRFERSVDEATSAAALTVAWKTLARAGAIPDESAMGSAVVATGVSSAPDAPAEISMVLDMPRRYLGVEVDEADALTTFSRLGLDARVARGSYLIRYNSRRPDITRAIDLVEELGRIRGLDDIPSLLPPGIVGSRHVARATSTQAFQPIMADATIARQRRLKNHLVGSGLSEAVTIALVDAARNADFGAIDTPRVVNAMTSTMASLRGSLMPGLLRSAGLNLAAGNARVSLFEVGSVFNEIPAVSDGPEAVNAGAVFAGTRAGGLFHHQVSSVDGWDVTGIVRGAVRAIGADVEIRRDDVQRSWLMPGECASLYVDGVQVGWVGQFHPDVLDPLEIELPVFGFELKVSDLLSATIEPVQARAVARKTPSYRDVALLVSRDTAWSQVDAAIRSRRPVELESWEVFDIYTGERVREDRMSLGVRLTYRPKEGAYTDEQLAAIHESLIGYVMEATGAERRA